ncbi:Signal recognition particle, SRP54 subunit,helical bundle [Ostreococcus tauri]|uniref:Signal recognition particle, SRP54 subunit,helical bundle n=1 Tax=Ostreococcus tauri TaxID=70448 RepID=Q01F74_OSTTA|nr:Signal recognition particle, SRP54 subunit,helical bundle [Ostreococcus tauri]CAL52027.1 Signal recognition particle, SRP54 subunit,helical bundle [Ostreococcus tauri]|eukprot:XP_003074769.1 Signal recognition particle, SRP54 subunit,helical bundle [Ostreococcus tauri]
MYAYSIKQAAVLSRSGLVLVNVCFTQESISLTELSEYVYDLKLARESVEYHTAGGFRRDKVVWHCDEHRGLIYVLSFEDFVDKEFSDHALKNFQEKFAKYYRRNCCTYDEFRRQLEAHTDSILGLHEFGGPAEYGCDFSVSQGSADCDSPMQPSKVSLDFSKSPTQGESDGLLKHQSLKEPYCDKVQQNISTSAGEFAGWCRRLFSMGTLTIHEDSVRSIMFSFKKKLMKRNVTSEVSDMLVDEVSRKLIGKEITTFESVMTIIHRSLEEAVIRVLSSARKVDILHDINRVGKSRPYVITFVGVNGVGKSTSLSKLVYWLTQQNFSVMVAACDTFRAGAVEQLRTHCHRLGCALYERGYERDPSTIAQQAIQQATRQNIDVVMIDTAGRMQDNEPLMRSLAKLLNVNKPDFTFFVGDALVGNDGVSQILQFERRLQELTELSGGVIDGIFLTKFDTIDEKVGAALSLVHASAIPVLFVGTGQTYGDLRRFQAEYIAEALLAN